MGKARKYQRILLFMGSKGVKKNGFWIGSLILGLSLVLFLQLFWKGVWAEEAQTIKIFPSSFSGNWQNPETIFSQDLGENATFEKFNTCLLYTSDAADE